MKLRALIILALCGWGGLVLGQDDPSKTRTLSVPAPPGCSEYDIRYDWGIDLVATFHHYYDKDGNIDKATAGVLASRPHTNRTDEQKLKNAFLLIRIPPDFSPPFIRWMMETASSRISFIMPGSAGHRPLSFRAICTTLRIIFLRAPWRMRLRTFPQESAA